MNKRNAHTHSAFVREATSFPAVGIFVFTLVICVLGFVSCSKDDEKVYPSLVTELAMSSSDADSIFSSFTTDDGRTFNMVNPLKGPKRLVRWRFICGYVDEGSGRARVYTFIRIPLLIDLTRHKQQQQDPTGLASIWKSANYINLHLLPKTQGEQQAWGFRKDSTHVNDAGGTNYYLSLLHSQLKDPLAYTDDLYVSLDLDSVSTLRHPTDSIIFGITTFDGRRSWAFSAE